MTELANCPECGALYVKMVISLCDRCCRSREKRFDKVYEFLRKKANRESTISETAVHTGVSETEILEFIREGRLQLADFPNFHILCAFCGDATRNSRLCKSCETELQGDIANINDTKKTYTENVYVNKRLHSRENE
ncbi:TIGR03826 family flagellar region protein [Salicibibacter cibarius]|nr:TIGR03826 family flagellar region protein [Salicibibacter cibarius]